PDKLYQAWLRGEIELVISDTQVAEIYDVLSRPRLRRFLDADEADAIVENIATRALIITELPVVNVSPDPKDNPVLASAIVGRAELIVSGDKKHMLDLGEVEGIPIVTARKALELMS
ncbi:MAG: putative toxin-antitoxin system toxin component, PIN family, partial [Gammaproteobacteria bacterium]|nr:putative toxin-antitoxin system toxin component, PIN family [Gammaproteobacteria bacterium]